MPTAKKLYLVPERLSGTDDKCRAGCRWRMTQVQAGLRVPVVRIRDMVREDSVLTVRMLADALNISKSTCHQILREDLGFGRSTY
jgi:hypothetical protein